MFTGKRQIGFRVANQLGHEKVYQCDHPGLWGYHIEKVETYAQKHQQTNILDGQAKGTTLPLTSVINPDSLIKELTLIDFIRWLNSKEVQNSSHAHYILFYNKSEEFNFHTFLVSFFWKLISLNFKMPSGSQTKLKAPVKEIFHEIRGCFFLSI